MASGENNEQGQEKEFEPTAHRLKKAYERGQLPISQELNHWVAIAAFLVSLVFVFPFICKHLLKRLTLFFGIPYALAEIKTIVLECFGLLVCGLFIMALFPIMVNVMQTYKGIGMHNLKPKDGVFSLIKGMKRIFSFKNLLNVIKDIFKIGAIFLGIFWVLYNKKHLIDGWIFAPSIVMLFKQVLFHVFGAFLLCYLVIVLFDVWYQRFSFLKQMKMSREELKQEYKEMEGDPELKSRLKQRRVEIIRKNLHKAIDESAFVVVNPTHYAVCIKWVEKDMDTPLVLAKGKNNQALWMREMARINNRPVIYSPALARSLYNTVKENQFILPEHYQAVADIIRMIESRFSSKDTSVL